MISAPSTDLPSEVVGVQGTHSPERLEWAGPTPSAD